MAVRSSQVFERILTAQGTSAAPGYGGVAAPTNSGMDLGSSLIQFFVSGTQRMYVGAATTRIDSAQLAIQAGTAASNALAKVGDTDTGFHFPAADEVAMAAGGNVLLKADASNIYFGTHSAIGAETVTGYITIKDSGGTLRKVAVVS